MRHCRIQRLHVLDVTSCSLLLFHWVNHPEKGWLNWVLGIAFSIVMILPVLGLLVSRGQG